MIRRYSMTFMLTIVTQLETQHAHSSFLLNHRSTVCEQVTEIFKNITVLQSMHIVIAMSNCVLQ